MTEEKTVELGEMKVRERGVQVTDSGKVIITGHHIVGDDGQTDFERNSLLMHSIPLLTLVQIQGGVKDGICLFVVNHSRDCDGSPLYDLSHDWKIFGLEREKMKQRSMYEYGNWLGKLSLHHSPDNLKLIKPSEEVVEGLIDAGWFDADGKPTGDWYEFR